MKTRLRLASIIRWFFLSILLLDGSPALADSGTFRDCEQCPYMIKIPSGTALIGSTMEEARRENLPMMGKNDIGAWERPLHEAAIPAFAMGIHEVTRAQFGFFVAESGYRPVANCVSSAKQAEPNAWKYSWLEPGFSQGDQHPVVCVSWTDAQAYADWLSERTDGRYRLPTEAEWEYAARAGSSAPRFWGDDLERACAYANSADQTYLAAYSGKTFLERYAEAGGSLPADLAQVVPCQDGYVETAPVGSFRANAFGLYDMLGNVWEWTEDCFHDSYHGAPSDGSAWRDFKACERAPKNTSELIRVFRGGSFSYPPYGLRSARRGLGGLDRRTWNRGFRVVREL